MAKRTDPGIHGLEYRRILVLLLGNRPREGMEVAELLRRYQEQWQTPRPMSRRILSRKLVVLEDQELVWVTKEGVMLEMWPRDAANLLDLATTV